MSFLKQVGAGVLSNLLSKIIIGCISLFLTVFGIKLMFFDKVEHSKLDESNNGSETNLPNQLLNVQGVLPYSENILILDSNLYIKNDFNEFVIGGKNLSKIRIGVRSYKGNDIVLLKRNMPFELYCRIRDLPQVEMEYKSRYYRLTISQNVQYHYKLEHKNNITMDLKSVIQCSLSDEATE